MPPGVPGSPPPLPALPPSQGISVGLLSLGPPQSPTDPLLKSCTLGGLPAQRAPRSSSTSTHLCSLACLTPSPAGCGQRSEPPLPSGAGQTGSPTLPAPVTQRPSAALPRGRGSLRGPCTDRTELGPSPVPHPVARRVLLNGDLAEGSVWLKTITRPDTLLHEGQWGTFCGENFGHSFQSQQFTAVGKRGHTSGTNTGAACSPAKPGGARTASPQGHWLHIPTGGASCRQGAAAVPRPVGRSPGCAGSARRPSQSPRPRPRFCAHFRGL